MCRWAILLPTPREPECRKSHTRSASSTVTSMKWLPLPSVPSCASHPVLSRDGSNPASSASRVSSSTRGTDVATTLRLWCPAPSGIARSMASRSGASEPFARSSSTWNWVRTAAMPQPMSTPTAAGMIARSVGITDPTVAPRPTWASGMRAMCGWMNGIVAARSACSRVPGSRIDAQLTKR
jgi:hypothetical protein